MSRVISGAWVISEVSRVISGVLVIFEVSRVISEVSRVNSGVSIFFYEVSRVISEVSRVTSLGLTGLWHQFCYTSVKKASVKIGRRIFHITRPH